MRPYGNRLPLHGSASLATLTGFRLSTQFALATTFVGDLSRKLAPGLDSISRLPSLTIGNGSTLGCVVSQTA
jgi:hypothetical protein